MKQNPYFVAKTLNYDIFVAKIYDYALIDSFWGFPGFIDSLTSYATLNASKTSQNNFVTDQWKKILSSIASTRQPTLTRKILEPFCFFVSVIPFCGVHEATITISLIGLQEYRNHLWTTGFSQNHSSLWCAMRLTLQCMFSFFPDLKSSFSGKRRGEWGC